MISNSLHSTGWGACDLWPVTRSKHKKFQIAVGDIIEPQLADDFFSKTKMKEPRSLSQHNTQLGIGFTLFFQQQHSKTLFADMRRKLPSNEVRMDDTSKPSKKVENVIQSKTVLDCVSECDRGGQFELDISNMNLTEFPQEAVLVSAIRHLKGHKNQFLTLPTLDNFRALIDLNLSRNQLIDISQVKFGSLINLKRMDLSRNCLEEIPDLISKCSQLEVKLFLPPLILSCHVEILFQVLMVHRNKLKRLPDGIGGLKSLRSLDASYNNIAFVGGVLETLPNLEDLNLGANENLEADTMATRTRRLHDKVVNIRNDNVIVVFPPHTL